MVLICLILSIVCSCIFQTNDMQFPLAEGGENAHGTRRRNSL